MIKNWSQFNEMHIYGVPAFDHPQDKMTPSDKLILYFQCLYGPQIDLDVITSTENLHRFIEYCKHNKISEEFAIETIEKYESSSEFRKDFRMRVYGWDPGDR